jgi:flagellar hook-associated protein 1 FlgK
MAMSFDIAVGGLRASSEALKVVSDNIANANTEGYKKRELVTGEMLPHKKNGISYGNGVIISQIKTVSEPYLLEKLISSNSSVAYNETLSNDFSKLEEIIASEELSDKVQDFFNAFDNLKNDPLSEGNKKLVVAESQKLLNIFDYNLNVLKEEQESGKIQIEKKISEINQIIEDFTELAEAQNYIKHDNNYIGDEVERTAEKLSKYGKVDTYFKEDGTVTIAMNGITLFERYEGRELRYEAGEIMVGDNEITSFFKNSGSIGAKLEMVHNGTQDVLEKYSILQTSMMYEVNQLIQNSVVKEMSSNLEGSDILSVSKNREILGKTKEELPHLKDTPLMDIPTIKGIQPGNITIKTYPEENEFIININHKTTLNSLKESFENYRVTGLEKDFIPVYDNNGNLNVNGNTLYGVEKGDVINNSFFDLNVENGINIKSEKPFSIEDGDTNFMDIFGMNNFFEYSETEEKYKINEKFENDPIKLFEYFEEGEINSMEHNKLILNDIVDLNHKNIDFDKDYLYNLSVANCPELNYTDVGVQKITSYANGVHDFNFDISLKSSKFQEQYESIQKSNDFLSKNYQDIVGVNTDEELTKLMKLQSAYQANAKVITAMNELFDSLLRI